MLDFQLYRIKVLRSPGALFSSDDTNAALLRQVIVARPEKGSGTGYTWRVGNSTPIDDSAYYFAFGRTTRSAFPVFDPTDHSFAEEEFESSPFTHVIVDVDLGVGAIAKKAQLAS